MTRWRRWILGFAVVALLVTTGTAPFWLVPDGASIELVTTLPEPTENAPLGVQDTGRWVGVECPLTVTLHEPDDTPARVPVELSTDDAAWSDHTDADGVIALQPGCGPVRIEAYHPDHPTLSRVFDTRWNDEVFYRFRAGTRIWGVVQEPDGTPVENARLDIEGHDWERSEFDGGYELWVDRAGPHVMRIDDQGFEPELEVVVVPPDAHEVRHDVVLDPAHRVEVRCAGLEDDSCAWVPLILCTEPHLPVGTYCPESGGTVRCRCPTGPAAVRGGGRAVLIDDDDDIAWLDFRAEGALSGRVLVDGEPARCRLSARPGLGMDLRIDSCDDDGVFVLENLETGTWTLELEAQGVERSISGVEVEGAVDLGDIELTEGTLVTGVVFDAISGEPVPGVSVAAVVVEDARPLAADGGTTDHAGRYAIRGLPAGQVEVFLPLDPLERASGVLVDELTVDLVRDPPGDVSVTRDRADLVVSALGADAPAGLQVGDRILGVELFGVDPDELIPGSGKALLEPLVAAHGVPGVTLFVRRAGETWELD